MADPTQVSPNVNEGAGSLRGSARSRSVSMADVAAAAGVSQQTVSRVVNNLPNVNEKTRERVREAMKELGFRPNYAGRSLRGGAYHSVGLCVNDITQIGNLTMLDGISSAARDHGYAITLIEMSKTAQFSLEEASRRMAELPVDAMIIGMSRMAPDFETFVPQTGMNTVLVTMYAHPLCTTVDSDHYGCSTMVMDHLFEHGHREIRFVAGPEYSIDNTFREAGWRDALMHNGIEPVEPMHGDWSAQSGYEIGMKLAQDAKMTAVYAANDQMAMGVIAALMDCGIDIPGRVSVIGVDDSLDNFLPNNELTTVRFDLHKRGRTVFESAVRPLDPDKAPQAIRIPGALVRRKTVADACL